MLANFSGNQLYLQLLREWEEQAVLRCHVISCALNVQGDTKDWKGHSLTPWTTWLWDSKGTSCPSQLESRDSRSKNLTICPLTPCWVIFYVMPRELVVTCTSRYLKHREGPHSPSPSRMRVTQLHATTAKTLVVKHGTTPINSWAHVGTLGSPKLFVFREYIHLWYLLS